LLMLASALKHLAALLFASQAIASSG
jgi:hypothetical protein